MALLGYPCNKVRTVNQACGTGVNKNTDGTRVEKTVKGVHIKIIKPLTLFDISTERANNHRGFHSD